MGIKVNFWNLFFRKFEEKKQQEVKEEPKEVKLIEWIDMTIYPFCVMFSVGFTFDEIMEELKNLNNENADGWIMGLEGDKALIDSNNYFALKRVAENTETKEKRIYSYIIITDQFRFTDREMAKLAHEVLHICQFVLSDFLDIDKEREAVAYAHTYLMEQCLLSLRGKK